MEDRRNKERKGGVKKEREEERKGMEGEKECKGGQRKGKEVVKKG